MIQEEGTEWRRREVCTSDTHILVYEPKALDNAIAAGNEDEVFRTCCTSNLTLRCTVFTWALKFLTHELLHVQSFRMTSIVRIISSDHQFFARQHQLSIPDLARLQQGLSHNYGVSTIIAKDVWSLWLCALSLIPLPPLNIKRCVCFSAALVYPEGKGCFWCGSSGFPSWNRSGVESIRLFKAGTK